MSITNAKTTSSSSFALLLVFLVVALVYAKGLFGGFLFDDYPNIVNNATLQAVAQHHGSWLAVAESSKSGPLHRPISSLSFAADLYFFGFEPLAFKLHNLAIHLINGLLLYALALRLIPQLLRTQKSLHSTKAYALLVTAVWLLHPLHVSNVLYIVQRMNLLATLFTLAGLLCYAEGRIRTVAEGGRGLVLSIGGLVLFGILATLSKENGALELVYALVIEIFCFGFAAKTKRDRTSIFAFFAIVIALPGAILAAYLATHIPWLVHWYAGRDFTVTERLLSEARVVCDYLLWILIPLPHWMGIFHDDFDPSTGLLNPATTIVSVVFLVALAGAAWRLRRSHPAFAFAVAWFLAGHSMESTIIPLELIFDHRNYLPMAGLILGIVCTLAPWLQAKIPSSRLTAICGALLVAALAAITATRTYAWGDPTRLALTEAANHPTSSRAQYEAGRMILYTHAAAGDWSEGGRSAIPYFQKAEVLDKTDLFATSGLFQIYGHESLPITPEMVDNLAFRARHDKSRQFSPLIIVLSAITNGAIALGPDQVSKIVSAALENPSLGREARASVLNSYAQYYRIVLKQAQDAVSLMLAAEENDPQNIQVQLNLSALAVSLGKTDVAIDHLRKAKLLDTAGRHLGEEDALQDRISEMMQDGKTDQPVSSSH